jgi:hypothetical protein
VKQVPFDIRIYAQGVPIPVENVSVTYDMRGVTHLNIKASVSWQLGGKVPDKTPRPRLVRKAVKKPRP